MRYVLDGTTSLATCIMKNLLVSRHSGCACSRCGGCGSCGGTGRRLTAKEGVRFTHFGACFHAGLSVEALGIMLWHGTWCST